MLKKIVLITAALLLAGFVAVSAGGKKEVPLGSEENPVVWAYVPSGELQQVAAGAEAVANLLHAKTGLYFKTLVATEYAGVIEAMRADPPLRAYGLPGHLRLCHCGGHGSCRGGSGFGAQQQRLLQGSDYRQGGQRH